MHIATCSKCGHDRPLTEFYVHAKQGYRFKQCKECVKQRARENRAKNPAAERARRERIKADPVQAERQREMERLRRQKPERKAQRKAYFAEFKKANREKVNEQQRAYRAARPDLCKREHERWNARRKAPDMRERRSNEQARRRALMHSVHCSLTHDDWEQIKADWDHLCAYCGDAKPLTRDHVIPITKGGAHSADNIVPACLSCNARKGARAWVPGVPVPSRKCA